MTNTRIFILLENISSQKIDLKNNKLKDFFIRSLFFL
jgi:hypothetical protein